jgi:hypothetical protein
MAGAGDCSGFDEPCELLICQRKMAYHRVSFLEYFFRGFPCGYVLSFYCAP